MSKAPTPAPANTKVMDTIKSFAFGGIAGCIATSVIQPLDTIKVRIQVISEEKSAAKELGGDATAKARSTNPIKVAQEMLTKDGFASFYKGLDAAILRQILYATVRLGLFQVIQDEYKDKYNQNMGFWQKTAASMFSGFVGSLVGNPADLALVRFQCDSLAPVDKRRNYKHVGDALTRMVKEEGLATLWRGSTPTIVRAMAMNVGMLTSYEEIKERIIRITKDEKSVATKVLSSACAGVICATMSLPPDNVKTKLMKMRAGPDGKMPYTGLIDCFAKSIKREGFFKLWVGLETFIIRVCPHAVIALLVNDYLNSTYGRSKVY